MHAISKSDIPINPIKMWSGVRVIMMYYECV